MKKINHIAKLSAIFLLICNLTACQRTGGGDAPVLRLGYYNDAPSGAMTVHKGDTLRSIAERYHLPLEEIITMNGLTEPYNIHRGQRLKLPSPDSYKIRENDTLYSVSQVFGVGIDDIVTENNLQKPYQIYIGQSLRIPSRNQYFNDMNAPVALKKEQRELMALHIPEEKPSQFNRTAHYIKKTWFADAPKFDWPIKGRVLSSYGRKLDGTYNDGINISARKGARVYGAGNGQVAYVGDDLNSFGNLVLVKHDDGWVTAYAHLDRVLVHKGMEISSNDIIGTVGTTGSVRKPQLHFEVRKSGDALNPKKYL